MKAYGLESYQRGRAQVGFTERSRLFMKILSNRALVDPFLEAIGGLAAAGLFAFAGWRAMSGESSAGALVGFIVAIAAASPEVRALGTLNSVLGEGLAAADRVYAAIDAKQTVVDAPDAVNLDTSVWQGGTRGCPLFLPRRQPGLAGAEPSVQSRVRRSRWSVLRGRASRLSSTFSCAFTMLRQGP